MTLKEMKKERDRLGKLICEAKFLSVQLPEDEIIRFRVKLYAQHCWRTLFYADSAEQAIADLESLRDALDAFLEEFRPWAEGKEEQHVETKIH